MNLEDVEKGKKYWKPVPIGSSRKARGSREYRWIPIYVIDVKKDEILASINGSPVQRISNMAIHSWVKNKPE